MLLISGFIFFLLLSIDMATKTFATTFNKSLEIIPDFFSLTYTENYGAAFGIGQGKGHLFILVGILVSVFLLVLLLHTNPKKKLPFFVIPAIIAGAVGNCLDRAINGFVVDFLDFTIMGYSFPVFNFADICICVGAIILTVAILANKKDDMFISRLNMISEDKK